MGDKKKSLKDWAAEVRSKVDVPEGVSDYDLLRLTAEADPEVVEDIRIQDRAIVKPSESAKGGVASRFAEGMATPFVSGIEGMIKGFFDDARKRKVDPMGAAKGDLEKALMGGPGSSILVGLGKAIAHPEKTLGVPQIAKELERGNTAGAVGQATTTGISLASLLSPFGKAKGAAGSELENMLQVGKGSLKEGDILNLAKVATREHSAILDGNIAGIRQALDKQIVNAQSIRQAIAKPMRLVSQIEKSPMAQVKDVSAAKDVLQRLSERTKKGMLPWGELQDAYKEISNAEGGLKGASQLRTELGKIKQVVRDELEAGAKAGGQGKEFGQWMKDYNDLASLQRSLVRIRKGAGSMEQLTDVAAPKPGLGIPKTKLMVGGRNAAKAAGKEIKNWQTAAEQLKGRIKANKPPAPAGTPPPMPPPQAPPGQAVPPAGPGAPGAAPQVPPSPPQAGGAGLSPYQRYAKGKPPMPPAVPRAPGAPQPAAPPQAVSPVPTNQTWVQGQGAGANFTADQLAAFKRTHGIE